MKLKQYITDGTFDRGEVSTYQDRKGNTAHIYKKGSSYYVDAEDYDFDAKNKKELKQKLKDYEFTINVAGDEF